MKKFHVHRKIHVVLTCFNVVHKNDIKQSGASTGLDEVWKFVTRMAP